MLLFSMEEFCSETATIMQFIGYIITIIKIAIPILIIAFGILDLGKAVVSSDDSQIKKSAKSLMWRAIAGVFIFFIPSIVLWLFGAIDQYKDNNDQFSNCTTCLLKPNECHPSKQKW